MTLDMQENGVETQLLAHVILTIKNDVLCMIRHF
jgi:hypothetical protein